MGTKIEWTADPTTGQRGETWNFLVGCSRDNAECDSCYAMHQTHRGLRLEHRGLTKLRPRDAKRPGVDWTGEVRVLADRLARPLGWKRPRNVFVNSISDLFHAQVPFEVIAAAFGVMAATPRHTYQVLTKRPERAREFFAWVEAKGAAYDLLRPDGMPSALLACAWEACVIDDHRINEDIAYTTPTVEVFGTAWPLANVHLGVSAGRQETADEKIPVLLQLDAAVRWVSAEPLLGPIDLRPWLRADAPSLDWLVVGGESGHGARPLHVSWVQDIRDQCRAAGVAVFVKQLGPRPIIDAAPNHPLAWLARNDAVKRWPAELVVARTPGTESHHTVYAHLRHSKGGDPGEWPEDLRVREWPAR